MTTFNVFNRQHLRQHRMRAAENFCHHRFLYDWCEQEILDRLAIIRRNFPAAALLQDRSSPGFQRDLSKQKDVSLLLPLTELPTAGSGIVSDSEFIPLAPASMDMIVSILDLHTINDLPGTLLQIRRALKPDGLFIACMAGGETLYELRSVLMEAELQTSGGASPRVFPFADKQQMGALLQRAGFALPVVDSDILRVSYRNLFHLMDDLRGMGESNIIAERRKTFMPRSFFMQADEIYGKRFRNNDGTITASFEIISLIGWAPHQSQQIPLRPGSAKIRLSDALGTKEIKTHQ
jgi:hypothetical protein